MNLENEDKNFIDEYTRIMNNKDILEVNVNFRNMLDRREPHFKSKLTHVRVKHWFSVNKVNKNSLLNMTKYLVEK